MRVLLVATVQSHIAQFHKPLMKALKEKDWIIHVAARDNLSEKNGLSLEYPDQVFDIPFRRSPYDLRNITAYRKLTKILREEHYDVIHCNTPVGGLLTRLAARPYRKKGTRVFYTAHGFHFYKGAPKKNWLLYYPIEKWLARFTDKLITITTEDYDLAKTKFRCPIYHIHGVGANNKKYCAIPKEQQEKQKAELGLTGHIIMNVGELLPNKNQKTAIRVVKALLPFFPDICLLIAGNGPEKENLEQLIDELSLHDHVILLGYTTQLEKYMQVCDALISCSYREGLPLNVLEAMLCGKPVVASNNRGHRELITDGTNGILNDPDDVEGYASGIQYFLLNEGKFASAIRNSALPYTCDAVTRELNQIYGNG